MKDTGKAFTFVLATMAILPGDVVSASDQSSIARTQPRSATSSKRSSNGSVSFDLHRAEPPFCDPNAEYMSLGPLATNSDRNKASEEQGKRLRVTISKSERTTLLTVEEVWIGRADSRTVRAAYRFDPYAEPQLRASWTHLQNAPRVPGPEPTRAAIEWLSPSAFMWVTRADTLLVAQETGSRFQVTIRPRVR